MTTDSFIAYSQQMLVNITEELNIKQVRLHIADKPIITVIFNYDTIASQAQGFTVECDNQVCDAPKTLLIALISFFSGNVLADMAKVREIVNSGLAQRAKAHIKVRQPLQSITMRVLLAKTP